MKKFAVVLMGLVLLLGLAYVPVCSAQTKAITPSTDCPGGALDIYGKCAGKFPEPAEKAITPSTDCPGGALDIYGKCAGKFPEPAVKPITPSTDCPGGSLDIYGKCAGKFPEAVKP
jgi:uncharacterized protein YchJ